MGVSKGSWWVNPKTRQRMVVATWYQHRTAKNGLFVNVSGNGRGDRIPCHLEGRGLYLVWLTEDEIRGGWETYRPLKDTTHVPQWMADALAHKAGTFMDVLVNDQVMTWDQAYSSPDQAKKLERNALCNSKYGWVCLTGVLTHIGEDEEGDFSVQTAKINLSYKNGGPAITLHSGDYNWGLQQFTTYFLPMKTAAQILRPRFNGRGLTALDRLVMNDEV